MKQRIHIRILIVDLSERFGGASSRALGLLGALPEGSAALAGLEESDVSRQARSRGFEFYSVARRKTDPAIPARLSRLVKRCGFQVLDAQNIQSKIWSSLASCLSGAAVVSTLNSWYRNEHGNAFRGRAYQFLEWATVPATDLYITVSPEISNALYHQGRRPEQVRYIPNAVDTDMTAAIPASTPLFRNMGIPADSPVACAVGRLVEAKGYGDLLEALPLMRNTTIHVVIVGDGHLRTTLADHACRLGLESRIHFAGFQPPDRTLSIIAAASVFLMPSRTEGTPIALLEAASLAKPIVATRAGGIPDILKNDVHGLLVAPGAPGEFAEALDRMIDRPGDALSMGKAARERIRQNFSLKSQAAATLDAYGEAWHRHRENPGTLLYGGTP